MMTFRKVISQLRGIEEGISGGITSSCKALQLLEAAQVLDVPKAAGVLSSTLATSAGLRAFLIHFRAFTWLFDSQSETEERIIKFIMDMLAASILDSKISSYAYSGVLTQLYTGFAAVAVGELLMAIHDYNKVPKNAGNQAEIKEARNNLIVKTLSAIGWTLLATSQPLGWIFIAATSAYYLKKDVLPVLNYIGSGMWNFVRGSTPTPSNQQPQGAIVGAQPAAVASQPTIFRAFQGTGHKLGGT